MFGGSQVLLLCAILGMAYALELRGAREGSCRAIQNIPTMDVDPVWLDSLHYINAGNKFHLYRQASTHPRFSQMREDEFYYDACYTKNTSIIEGNGSIFGFGGRVLGSFDVEPSRDPRAIVDAYPNNPQTGPRSDFFRQRVTLTDHRTFAVMVHCWMGVDQKSWDVYSLLPQLDMATERLISDHIQALGFSKENFVFLRYGHCKGLEASGGNKQGQAGGGASGRQEQKDAQGKGNNQGSASNRSSGKENQGGNLSRLNPKDQQQQRPVVDMPGQDLSFLQPKVRGVGMPTIRSQRRNQIDEEESWSQKSGGNNWNQGGGSRASGSGSDDDSQQQRPGNSMGGQSGNRLERLQDGREQSGNNRETGQEMGGGQGENTEGIGGWSRPDGDDDDEARDNSMNSGGNAGSQQQQQNRLTRPAGPEGSGQRQRPDNNNNEQSGSIKRGIPSGGATTLRNAGGSSTTASPVRGRLATASPLRGGRLTTSSPARGSSTRTSVTRATQRTTKKPRSTTSTTTSSPNDGEGHGWSTQETTQKPSSTTSTTTSSPNDGEGHGWSAESAP